jgi:limonene-1,2-epoxide hydrolase
MQAGFRSIALILAGGLILMTATIPAHADTDAQKLKTAKEMIRAWDTLDWAKVVDLFSDDGVLHSMMVEPVVGKAAIRERITALGAGIRRIELKVAHIGIIDGRVFIERVDDFDYKGHAGTVPVVGVLEIENGHVRVWREYYDRAQLLHAMGADLPAAGH